MDGLWDGILVTLSGMVPWGAMALQVVGGLCVVASAVVKVSPSVEDDNWWSALLEKPMIGPLLKALLKFSVFQMK